MTGRFRMVTYFSRGILKLSNLQDIESKQSALKAHFGSREPSVKPRALIPPMISRTPPLEMKRFHKISCMQVINFLKGLGAARKSERIKKHRLSRYLNFQNHAYIMIGSMDRVWNLKRGQRTQVLHPVVNTSRKSKAH
ncbi:hypothetical protein M9H77_08741 [Catharanthus roseus]|uniref:Uncharacterized protein n=1 Tax=Catharanthus roseus TaxID=4058 RepID=A0ACC0BYN3_CATRO|nr:hypothetical protein M9H77_08741 [Catharanthus roseus]